MAFLSLLRRRCSSRLSSFLASARVSPVLLVSVEGTVELGVLRTSGTGESVEGALDDLAAVMLGKVVVVGVLGGRLRYGK